jgi:glucosylceramidase
MVNRWCRNSRTIKFSTLGAVVMTLIAASLMAGPALAAGETVNVWVTTPDQSKLLAQQSSLTFAPDSGSNPLTITVNPATTYQQVDGWGASLTDSSSWLIYNSSARNSIMNDLFNTSSGIGLSFLRQPMGASDFSRSGNYNFDNTCCDLNDFSISHDTAYITPLLTQARSLNSSVKVIITPWSPPGWMKTSGSMIGGSLNSGTYSNALAQYFVKTIQGYQAAGVPIYGLTVQNEPLYSPTGYPGSLMPAADQGGFIGANLGPALSAAGLGGVKIMAYDHNWDQPSYPTTVFNNASANPYVAGVAWHCYGGTVSAENDLHNSFPNKDTWLTECSGGNWAPYYNDFAANLKGETENLIILNARYWSKSAVLWNMALDPSNGPTNGGCTTCRGVVTVNGGSYTKTVDYYVLGQASKFVRSGAYRIASNTFGSSSIEDVAFKNPDGSIVVLALNNASSAQTFKILINGQSVSYTLPAGAVGTFQWTPGAPGPTPTPTPTPTSGTIDARSTIQAESYSAQSGTQTETTTDTGGGSDVGYIANGDYLQFNNVNFGTSALSTFTARVASGAAAGVTGNIVVHLDSPTGTTVATMPISPTGGWQTWQTLNAAMSGVTGTHTVYLTFTSSQTADFLNINWFTFSAGSTPTPTPAPTGTVTLLSQGKAVTCSSTENATYPCANAVDGSTTTRWSSAFSDPQWIYVDLGATHSISQVTLNWEAAYASAFQIQTSNDAATWTSIYSTTAGTGGVQTLNVSGSGRYVRMSGTARATAYGYSLWEFQVRGI